jgi:transcriptional regulator with XRE-family HTH domain
MDLEKAVGAELKAAREKRRISQEQLGFDAGIHRTYVSLIERGVENASVTMLFRLRSIGDSTADSGAESIGVSPEFTLAFFGLHFHVDACHRGPHNQPRWRNSRSSGLGGPYARLLGDYVWRERTKGITYYLQGECSQDD